MIFKSSEKHSLGNYKTIMLGIIFGKFYGFVMEKIINQRVIFLWVRERGHVGFREGKSTVDHILTLRTLIEQEVFGRVMSLFLFH